MRIRSTKPEFWRSERIAAVSWDARLVLKGLESYVDDNGVGKDDIALIVADVFPRDLSRNPRDTLARVSEAISILHQAGLLWRYEAEGTRLLYISWWEEIQRIDKPGKGRLPRPDGTMDYKSSIIRESVASPRETVAPGTEEQRNRGTEEKDLPDPDGSSDLTLINLDVTEADYPNTFETIPESKYPADFEAWWEHYPRKVGKAAALKAWRKALKRATKEELIAGAIRYAEDPNRVEQFTKYPEGWLSRDGWLDEPIPGRKAAGGIKW
ncbi:RepA-like replication initiator [Mycobacterium phage Beakin]|nr:helix-turn-helix DNA binding protein [Mycobacterium phage Saroj]UVK63057.1 RepA-like replication initiator [Mycobacterium phage Beakin]UZV39595.1 HTH DNA binding protein [Mycobacterium phage Ritam007]